MSGFEVAGVVLGSIPLLVGALQFYIEGASTLQRWRFYTRELKSLIRSLQTEHTKLQNVCERLLVNIVPETKIEDMINDPFGPLWKEETAARKIRERLWRSAKVFEDNVLDMNEAIEEIKKKLHLDPDGKPKWMGSPGVKKELQRILFVLRRSDYQELIERLRTGVSSLESLVSSNVELERDRNRRSRGRVCKVVRSAAMGVYNAIRGTVTCGCPGLHSVILRLTPQPVTITPEDDDEDVIKTLNFHIAMSYASTLMAADEYQWGSLRLWNQVVLRPLKIEQDIPVRQPTPSSFHSKSKSSRTRQRAKVSFASATTAIISTGSTNITSTSTTTAPSFTSLDVLRTQWTPTATTSVHPPSNISNLCQALRRSQKQGAGECCGHVIDNTSPVFRKFEVFPLNSLDDADSGTWSMVPLGAVLGAATSQGSSLNGGTQHTPLTYLDRLRLAWTVASSAVQLQNTPWLSRPPTHNDIFLIRQDNEILRRDAFVLKRFPDKEGPTECGRTTAPAPTTASSTVLSALGVLLIELIIGQTIETICTGSGANSGTSTQYDLGRLGEYRTLTRILDRVNTLGGSNYHSAVRRCIKQNFYLGETSMNGDDEMAQQNAAFFEVIGFLEQDMEIGAAVYEARGVLH